MRGWDFHQLLRDLVFIILTYGRREVSWSVLMRKKREVAIVRRFLYCFFVGINSVSHSNIYSKYYKGELIEAILSKGWIPVLSMSAIFSVDSNHTRVWNWYKPNHVDIRSGSEFLVKQNSDTLLHQISHNNTHCNPHNFLIVVKSSWLSRWTRIGSVARR